MWIVQEISLMQMDDVESNVHRELYKKDTRLTTINQISELCEKYKEYARMYETIKEEQWDLNNPKIANTFYRIEELMKDTSIKIKKLSYSLHS